MLRKIILVGALASAISLSAFAACGKDGSCDFEKGKKGEMYGHIKSLSTVKLSAEQKTKINAINEEFRSEMAKLHIKEKPMMKDPFVVAGGFDKETFKKEASEKMQKHLELKAEHLAKIWSVLTDRKSVV